EGYSAHWFQIFPLFNDELGLCTSGNGLNPQAGIAAPVGDEGDFRSVRGPAGICVVVITIGDWENVSSRGGHEPELMPRGPQIRGIDLPFPVWREIGAGFPVRLLIVDFVRLSVGLRPHPPEAAGTVDATVIGDKQNL